MEARVRALPQCLGKRRDRVLKPARDEYLAEGDETTDQVSRLCP